MPSLNTIAGISVWNGRLPGANWLGCPGSSEKPVPRLCSMMPVSPATTPDPKALKMLLMNDTAIAVLVDDREVGRVAAAANVAVRRRVDRLVRDR